MSKETRRINIVVDKDLWHNVSVESAKLGITKREFAISALESKLNEQGKIEKAEKMDNYDSEHNLEQKYNDNKF